MLSERTTAPAPAASSSPALPFIWSAPSPPPTGASALPSANPRDVGIELSAMIPKTFSNGIDDVDPVEQEQQRGGEDEGAAEADDGVLQRPVRPAAFEPDEAGQREVQAERDDEQAEDDERAQRRAVQPDLLGVDEREAEDDGAGDAAHEVGQRRRSLSGRHADGGIPGRRSGATPDSPGVT